MAALSSRLWARPRGGATPGKGVSLAPGDRDTKGRLT